VFVLGALDCLEIPPFGGAGNFPHLWGVVLSHRSGGLVIFVTEDSQVGGPPRFGVMGKSGCWHVFLEESYQSVELRGGGACRRGRDLETLDDRVQGFPVCVCPSQAWRLLVQ